MLRGWPYFFMMRFKSFSAAALFLFAVTATERGSQYEAGRELARERLRSSRTKLRSALGKYPPAKPGALGCEPLKAVGGRWRGPLNLEPPKAACQRQRFICSSL